MAGSKGKQKMKIALGMILKNEERMLMRHLGIISKCFDGAVFLDDGSTDQSLSAIDSNCHCDYNIGHSNGDISFSEKRNAVIKQAEELGYDAIFFLDADECMFPRDINEVKYFLEYEEIIALPRYEFGWDRNHYDPTIYPDYQGRVFCLNKGYHYQGNIHEILFPKDSEKSVEELNKFFKVENAHIYHYGRCRTPEAIAEKYERYNRIITGIPEDPNHKPDTQAIHGLWKNVVEFKGDQPV